LYEKELQQEKYVPLENQIKALSVQVKDLSVVVREARREVGDLKEQMKQHMKPAEQVTPGAE